MFETDGTRARIFKALVKSKRVMTQSDLARALKIPPQKIYYHLPFLEADGLVVCDGHHYFCQPIFLDRHAREVCSEKLAEIIDAIAASDIKIIDAGDGLERDDLVLNCLRAMIALEIPTVVDR